MLEIPSIIRIIAETYLLKLCDLAIEPQGYKVRESNNFTCTYRIAGKFGGEKVWRIASFRAFGERKFGELIDQPIGYQL